MTIGLIALARPTFDVAFAEQQFAAMRQQMADCGQATIGGEQLLFDEQENRAAIGELAQANISQVWILQVTFTDAAMTCEVAEKIGAPLVIWAIPEPRLGGRLRLNSFCGLNLASHALARRGKSFSAIYADPASGVAEQLKAAARGELVVQPLKGSSAGAYASAAGQALVAQVQDKRIARIGDHPAGFDTCRFEQKDIHALARTTVQDIDLQDLFNQAAHASPDEVRRIRARAEADLDGLDQVNQAQLDKSLRLKAALDHMQVDGQFDAFAIRCWPETFTEYGGAVCGAVSMMGEQKKPCACEADVYGALTQLLAQEAAAEPVFLVDLVDLDVADGTGVVWHCGQAPISMKDSVEQATATIHTNRKMPLLYEFPLKAGRVTLCRLSQARGETTLVLAGGEMLARPMAFTGTSGVVQFDTDTETVLANVLASGLEHHMALAYGDHRPLLRSAAAALDIPVLEL